MPLQHPHSSNGYRSAWPVQLALSFLIIMTSACSTTGELKPEKAQINAEDLLVVDCLLPPQARQLGTRISYLSQRRAIRTSGADCALRGGEYVAYNRADFKTALAVWLPQAQQGDPEAQTYVGEIYEKGLGTRKSYELAASWYKRAASQNYPRAQINLGYLFESGLGVKRDLPRALNLYRQASGFTAAELEFVSSVEIADRRAAKSRQQALQAEVQLLQSEIQAGRGQLHAQKHQLRQREIEIRELQDTLTSLSAQSPVSDTRSIEQSLVDNHKKELSELKNRLDNTTRLKHLLEQQLASESEDTAILQDRYSQTVTTLQKTQQELESNNQKIKELESQIQTRDDDSTALVDALREATGHSEQLLGKITSLESENRHLAEILSTQIRKAHDARLALALQIAQQKTAIDRIEQQRQSEIAAYQQELAAKARVIQDMQDGLTRRDAATNESRSLKQESTGQTQTNTSRRSLKGIDFGQYHALIIGNDTYDSLSDLETAGNDAIAVEQIFREKYGFRTILLLDANQKTILSALERLRATLGHRDNLVIYYAGHGELDKQSGRGYWLPVDSEATDKSKWIANSAISSMIDTMKAKHVLIIADSCYSGYLSRSSIARPLSGATADLRWKWLKAVSQSRVRTVLSSGGSRPVLDGSANSDHSIFATQFLDALTRNIEVLEAYELFFELQQRVAESAARFNVEQIPQYAPIRHAGHQAGEFIFLPVAQTTVGGSSGRNLSTEP